MSEETEPKPIDLAAYRERVNALPESVREKCEDALERVITAYMLSRGPSEDRSAVWRPKLRRRVLALDYLLVRYSDFRLRS